MRTLTPAGATTEAHDAIQRDLAILREAGAEAHRHAMGRNAVPEAVQLAREPGALLALDDTLQNAELVR